jgi:hypothetical protein
MILSTRLKICTIVCHALIITGMGHGIVPFVVLEIFSFYSGFIDGAVARDPAYSLIVLAGVLALLGQILTIWAIYVKKNSVNKLVFIGGIVFLWSSVIFFAWLIRHDNYSHLAGITCLPFAICTIWALFGNSIRNLWRKFMDWV